MEKHLPPLRRKPHPRRRHPLRRLASPWVLFGLVIVSVAAIDVYLFENRIHEEAQVVPVATQTFSPAPTLPISTATPLASATPSTLPKQALITMPFLVQAPFANWDALHEDACEEASLIMVKHFLDGTPVSSDATGDTEIKEVVAAGEELGQGLSITLEQLRMLANAHYKLSNGSVVTGNEVTVDAIKAELAAGHPVIVPAAGKLLGNPHFSNGGPNYHMLVVKGYDADGFITNDPGIREGENYRYPFATFYSAIHDWDPANILNGQKAYLVFK